MIPLSDLPSEMTSFTYPDSITAMALVRDLGLPYEPKPYHERVFRIEQLDDVIGRYGLLSEDPDAAYDGYQNRPFEMYLEVHFSRRAIVTPPGRGMNRSRVSELRERSGWLVKTP